MPSVRQAEMKLIIHTPDEPVYVTAEKDLLLNLIENLTDNARKASAAGDSIRISAWNEKSSVMLEVADEGKGIPEAERDKVFETFYMVDKVRGKNNDGVGLGLSICADIVKIHHATIELESKEHEGTRFKIIFPRYYHDTIPG